MKHNEVIDKLKKYYNNIKFNELQSKVQNKVQILSL